MTALEYVAKLCEKGGGAFEWFDEAGDKYVDEELVPLLAAVASAADRFACLPHPLSKDERTKWLEAKQRVRDALAELEAWASRHQQGVFPSERHEER